MPILYQYLQALVFYFVFFALSLVGLSLTLRIFKNQTVAFATAKITGLIILGLTIWWLSFLHLVDYQNNFLLTTLFVVALLGGIYFNRKYFTSNPEMHFEWRSILTVEIISLFLYFLYLYLRSLNPSAYGTERFMDMMLLTSAAHAHYFPFLDSWYINHAVNYYYFGHYLFSLIVRLGHLDPALAYNFSIGLIYTTATTLAGLFVWQITRSKFFSLLAGFLVTTAGNLFYASCVVKSFLAHQSICSYASSTRLYTPSYIINEIPSYSFTVGDLHAHFIALPFFIFSLFVIYEIFKIEKINWPLFLTTIFAFGASSLINPSDAVSLGFLLAAVLIYKLLQNYQSIKQTLFANKEWIIFGLALLASVGFLTLPFTLNFVSPVLGFGFAPIFAKMHNFWGTENQYPTPFLAQAGMWGIYLVVLIFFFVKRKNIREYPFPFLMLATSLFLLLFIELFFIKDIYFIVNPHYFRANTTFKFGYHVWVLFSISFSVCLYFIFANLKRIPKIIAGVFLGIFIFFSLFYPYQAIKQFYASSESPTLDGLSFMQKQYPDDYATVKFLSNLPERNVVVEAAGDSYTYFARLSAFSGQLTLIGWKSHEWTWHFAGAGSEAKMKANPGVPVETGYGPVALIANDVQTIYENNDAIIVSKILKKYSVRYVYVGDLERTTYPKLNEKKFYQLGKVVFSSGDSRLFEIE